MKNQNLALTAKWLAALLMAVALVACNNDDDAPAAQTPPPPAPVVVANVSGTAAVGVPLGNASVSAQCVTGPVLTGTTAVDGSWSIPMAGSQTFPCFVTVKGGTPEVELHSIAQTEAKINVTPLSDLVLAAAAGKDPKAWFATNSGKLAAELPALIAKLPAAQAILVGTLKASGYTVPDGNLLTVTFQAKDGDPYDDLLEAIKMSLADAGNTYADLVGYIATNNTGTSTVPFTDVLTAAEVAAMPQLNSATLAISGETLVMKTNDTPSGSPVGAYAGGGTGNKAVLQLPGFNRMKLSDFEEMSIELKAISELRTASNGVPYVSVNIMVDLDCTQPPLGANATVADARARHRLLTFDPFYKFMQETVGVSRTEFKTVTFTPETGGWRISAGAVAGNDTGVEEVEHGTQYKLTSFKYADYPNACIVDGISADGGLFRNTPVSASCNPGAALATTAAASCAKAHSGVFLFMGDSGMRLPGEYQIKKVSVNERTFKFK